MKRTGLCAVVVSLWVTLVFTLTSCDSQESVDRARAALDGVDGGTSADGGVRGDGSEAHPFRIYECRDLQRMERDLDAHYQLANDIDCTGFDVGDGRGFRPVGDSRRTRSDAHECRGGSHGSHGHRHDDDGDHDHHRDCECDDDDHDRHRGGHAHPSVPARGPFEGSLDGDGHLITGVTIARGREAFVGLFGATHRARIARLGLVDARIDGKHHVGGLVGWAAGTNLVETFVRGEISGRDHVGGLVGTLETSSAITDSYSAASVDARGWSRGLAVGAENRALVATSYASGTLSPVHHSGRPHARVAELVGGGAARDIVESFSTATSPAVAAPIPSRSRRRTCKRQRSSSRTGGTSRCGDSAARAPTHACAGRRDAAAPAARATTRRAMASTTTATTRSMKTTHPRRRRVASAYAPRAA